MEKRDLRKVIYSMEGEYSISSFEIPKNDIRQQEVLREMKKERQGLFHCFDNDGYAIVEDIETGEVQKTIPKRIRFIDDEILQKNMGRPCQ